MRDGGGGCEREREQKGKQKKKEKMLAFSRNYKCNMIDKNASLSNSERKVGE